MKEIQITAQLRENTGVKGKLNSIRKSGMIPAVVYGASKPVSHISISEKDFMSAIKSGRSAIIKMKYDNNEENVIIKEIQRHVVSGKILHIDFHRISLTEKIEVKVPIKLIGEAYGVKTQGGIIEHNMRELTIKCLPGDIPQEITIDITNLHIGNSVRVKDIKYENIEIKEEPEHIVASIIAPKEETVEVPAQAAAQEEPEVIAKGKKEETEGEVKEVKVESKKEEPKTETKK